MWGGLNVGAAFNVGTALMWGGLNVGAALMWGGLNVGAGGLM